MKGLGADCGLLALLHQVIEVFGVVMEFTCALSRAVHLQWVTVISSVVRSAVMSNMCPMSFLSRPQV